VKNIFLIWMISFGILSTAQVWSADMKPHEPGPGDKCPVCGMFVAKYPSWFASISFKAAPEVFFDGPKDMFTYYLNLKKYNPSQSATTIMAIHVKDYYSLKEIDARKALYVIGSAVHGPMGNELVPLEKAADAKAFMHDHNGKRLLRFDQINRDVMKAIQ